MSGLKEWINGLDKWTGWMDRMNDEKGMDRLNGWDEWIEWIMKKEWIG